MYKQEAARAADLIRAVPETLSEYKCPICEKTYASLTELTHHYAVTHPDAIVPVTVSLSLNGRRCEVLACTTLAIECENSDIQTIEGVAADPKWKPLVDAYCRWDAMQCGYCTPGFLVSAKALLDNNPHPTEEECREALAGNICICGTYPRHATAIIEAAVKMSEGGAANA